MRPCGHVVMWSHPTSPRRLLPHDHMLLHTT
jgi:hypothetical protein